MATSAIDFSDLGGIPVATSSPSRAQSQPAPQSSPTAVAAPARAIDFSDLGGKVVQAAPQQSGQSNSWLTASKDQLTNFVKGLGEGALQDVNTVSRVLNKIPGIGETLAPTAGINAARQLATPATAAEKLGAATEQAAELMIPVGGEFGTAAKMGIGALQGAGSVAMHEAGTTQGANPTDVAVGGALGAVAPAVEGAIRGLSNSKLARGMVNESVMATPRDVIYGNPAKALLDEDIATPFTGDLEKFKDAIRSGATLQGAADAAGGRVAAVSDKINEIGPELRATLAASKAKIPATVVTDPIDNGIRGILADRGVTQQEAQAAIDELTAIKQAALKVPTVPGATAQAWAPLEANTLKHEIGQSVDWAGRERIGQLVDPIKKQVYGNLKNAINTAAPGAADLNERFTNLLAAQSDINKLAGFEEVGRGRSMGGVIGPSWMGRAEALAGRFIPAVSWLSPSASAAIRSIGVPAVTQTRPGESIPLSSLLGGGSQ